MLRNKYITINITKTDVQTYLLQPIFHQLCMVAVHVYLQEINSEGQDYFTVTNEYMVSSTYFDNYW